jgi:protein phosphatase 4 regulatory subunit 3
MYLFLFLFPRLLFIDPLDDGEFPRHRAHHREYLSDSSKFRQVIKINDRPTLQKIHHTFRLQYLKDVVLARLMEEPVFSVLNSLIFFNQVDIVQTLCAHPNFIKDLFAIFLAEDDDRKRDAVAFIQQFCQISKQLQAPARTLLYNKCAENGLYDVIEYALLHKDLKVRLAGADVVMIAIEHDPTVLRSTIARQLDQGKTPLLITLYESIHREQDLGLKLQFFECVRILLDPSTLAPVDGMTERASHMLAHIKYKPEDAVVSDKFVSTFYRHWAADLCIPIIALSENEGVEQLGKLSNADAAVYIHLLELMTNFVRLHSDRFRDFSVRFSLLEKATVLLACKLKHVKLGIFPWCFYEFTHFLAALKFFRNCLLILGDIYTDRMMKAKTFGPIIEILIESAPRNNLLNSAVLELLQFIYKVCKCLNFFLTIQENKRAVLNHLVEMYGERFESIRTFGVIEQIKNRYAQYHDTSSDNTVNAAGQVVDRYLDFVATTNMQ